MKQFVLVIVVVAASLLTVHTNTYAQADVIPNGRFIAPILVKVAGGDFKMQIFRFDTDGAQRVNLTNTNVDEDEPRWSPDGTQIAFTSERDGITQIYVMGADGKEPKNLSNAPKRWDGRPAWSPDSSRIMFSTSAYDQKANESFGEIWVMNADGTNQVNLSKEHAHSDYKAVWSPDGKRIVFAGYTKEKSAIWVMDADGTNAKQLTDQGGEDSPAAWSPTGKQILFTRGYTKPVLWLMNADGTNARAITDGEDAVWSPDGEQIAFISALEGFNELYLMNSNGSNIRKAAPEPKTADLGFVWSPDSSQILVRVNQYSPNLGLLMLIDVGSKKRTMIVSDAYCGQPDWMQSLPEMSH